ncbi:MAG TPA: hypothetical protein VH856_09860 [Steroidobacteraceae bacterium]|jgi:hypothetical protein
MANQLTIRNDKACGDTARSLALAVAAAAGSQVLAFTAVAQDNEVIGPEEPDPIFYPEVVGAFVVGVVVGVVAVQLYNRSRKKKKDE